MATNSAPGKGSSRKVGRNKDKCKAYRLANTSERNKAKRVLQSNGKKYCEIYCKEHGIRLPANYHKE
jgi:hypothetical protein